MAFRVLNSERTKTTERKKRPRRKKVNQAQAMYFAGRGGGREGRGKKPTVYVTNSDGDKRQERLRRRQRRRTLHRSGNLRRSLRFRFGSRTRGRRGGQRGQTTFLEESRFLRHRWGGKKREGGMHREGKGQDQFSHSEAPPACHIFRGNILCLSPPLFLPLASFSYLFFVWFCPSPVSPDFSRPFY